MSCPSDCDVDHLPPPPAHDTANITPDTAAKQPHTKAKYAFIKATYLRSMRSVMV